MPLSEKDRVERQVLRYLHFHRRSPVPLRCDDASSAGFGCRDQAHFLPLLEDMHARNLFRILPSPGRTVEAVKAMLEEVSEPAASIEETSVFRRMLEAGVLAMITTEGEKRWRDLKKTTSKVRLHEYLREENASEPGTWIRSDQDMRR